jgi:uncharacterized protein involved in propanediol utilization
MEFPKRSFYVQQNCRKHIRQRSSIKWDVFVFKGKNGIKNHEFSCDKNKSYSLQNLSQVSQVLALITALFALTLNFSMVGINHKLIIG